MVLNERQNKLYNIIKEEKSISNKRLLEILFVSESTLRRDLTSLEKHGVIHRTHGGAIIAESANIESSILLRMSEQIKEKTAIARKAFSILKDNSTYFIDSSSTVGFLLPYFNTFKNSTIITNGLNNASILTSNTSATVYLTSGIIYHNTNSVLGIDTIRYLENFNANVFIFSCSGISYDEGIMEASLEQSIVKREMISRSKIHILLADYTKFNKIFMCNTTYFDSIDYVITDRLPEKKYIDLFKKFNVELLIAD